MIDLNKNNFGEFVKNGIVIVDFWATWCKPCYTVEQILKQLEMKYNHGTVFAKMNTDENLDVARKHNVLSLPTIIIFKDGEPIKRIVGSKSMYEFEEAIEEVVDDK